VDDDPQFADLTATFLERQTAALTVLTESTATAALQRLRSDDVDCIVSDHDLAETTGIDFLESVREEHPDLPFILFTGKGSEEVASQAISAGVTDYLQKGIGTDQYTILANRIENAVERSRSVQAARRRKRRLETLVSNLPGIVYRTRNEPGWPMESVDGECEALVGYAAEELESGAVAWGDDVLHPADQEEIWTVVQRAIEREEPFECTYRAVTADGTVKWLWERGRVVDVDGERAADTDEADPTTPRVLEGFVTDVTESQAREQELERNERRFEAVFNDPNLLVALLETDGTVLDVNQTALQYVDLTRSEIVGEAFASTPWWADGLQADVERWVDAAAAGEYVEYEATHPTSDAEPIAVEGVFRPVRDEAGAVTALVVSARNVTEQRKRERDLQRQNDRLGEFAGFISHDFQSPLSTARGRLELALDTGDLDHVETALDAVERIDELRTDLADTLRSGEIVAERERIAVEDVIERVWSTTDPGAEASFTVAEPTHVEADPDAFRRLIENLVRNSVEHGGPNAEVRLGRLAGMGGFYYEDDGPGLDPAVREKIFLPGFSTKASRDGTGMGMASVRQIVLAHGWEIDAGDAETLGGARFEVRTG
jgi:PAS domain S-box-containing protein